MKKAILFLLAIATIAVTSASLTSCEKEQIKPSSQEKELIGWNTEKVDSPVKGNWTVQAERNSNTQPWQFVTTPTTLHITNTDILEWGPYTYNSTQLNVSFPGGSQVVLYTRTGNTMVMTFQNGSQWKLAKT
jgi:hypothetical protein